MTATPLRLVHAHVATVGPVEEPDRIITCIDCGGRAHLTSYPPELGWRPGDITVYRCEDCLDAWYLEIPLDDV